ncbi:hypothetical protein SteCoe_1168 [Stentor coeruleus]|uniref:Uncharacterized protein n=1 Tax=Stentor coeruleus TaxID=5963 RepID=A0A1R2D2A3_9CILI|nr:hypothetical protein SteCoe_1168 [Stentor coeruleus]
MDSEVDSGEEVAQRLIKCIFVGDAETGKSSIIECFALQAEYSFSSEYWPTKGTEFRYKLITINNTQINLQIWDSAGQERYRVHPSSYYKNALCVFIVFSSDKKSTFGQIPKWFEEIDNHAEEGCKVVLIENEFTNRERQVNEYEGKALADKYHIDFFKANAENGEGINNIFYKTGQSLIDYQVIKPHIKFRNITEQLASISLESNIPKNNESISYKIILIGDCHTGKSSIVKRYINNVFFDSTQDLPKTDVYNKSVLIKGKTVNIAIWDIYCEEKFKSIEDDYFRNVNIIMIVYNSSNRGSFENIGNWFEESKKAGNDNSLIVVVECDKGDIQRNAERFEGEELAGRHNVKFYRVDAKMNEGVNELFEESLLQLMNANIQ